MADYEHIDGRFVGELETEELELFEWLVSRGKARRVYLGAFGLLGCATVELIP